MPAPLVNHDEVLRLNDQGLGAAKIVEHFAQHGVVVHIRTISAILRRNGRGRNRKRHEFLLPWELAWEHKDLWVATMLRTLNRMRLQEDGIPEGRRAEAERFLADLRRLDVVVLYDPDERLKDLEGWPFFRVPRDPAIDGDDEWAIIRRPRADTDQ